MTKTTVEQRIAKYASAGIAVNADGEIKFAPFLSRATVDFSENTFARSNSFAAMMERAHQYAVAENYSYR